MLPHTVINQLRELSIETNLYNIGEGFCNIKCGIVKYAILTPKEIVRPKHSDAAITIVGFPR